MISLSTVLGILLILLRLIGSLLSSPKFHQVDEPSLIAKYYRVTFHWENIVGFSVALQDSWGLFLDSLKQDVSPC